MSDPAALLVSVVAAWAATAVVARLTWGRAVPEAFMVTFVTASAAFVVAFAACVLTR
jgi:hypothetical protein